MSPVRVLVVTLTLLLTQGIDLAPLIRGLLDGRSADKSAASKPIRLEDEASHRKARLRVVDEGDSPVLVMELVPSGERLLPHTASLEVDGQASGLRILDLQLSRDHAEPEVVVMLLPAAQLSALTQAARAVLTLHGWDETFTAVIESKDLEKIRSFSDRRREGDSDGAEGSHAPSSD